MDIFTQMMRLPFDVVAMSIEPFLRMAREADRPSGMEMFRQAPGLITRGSCMPGALPGALPNALPSGLATMQTAPVPVSPPISSPLLPSAATSRRDDMNDNLLKLVQYYIVWTQPDVEVALDEDRILINYPTTSEELAGLILLNWVSAPPTEDRPNGNIALIPSQLVADRRYLKVRLHVIERFAVEDKYYDRRQTQAQEEIAETLERGFGG